MTSIAETHAIRGDTSASANPGFFERLRRRLSRAEMAMADQSRLSAMQPETLADTRLAAAELTGILTHDPALPFFLQSGFGRSNR